jgi:hypothetical protein
MSQKDLIMACADLYASNANTRWVTEQRKSRAALLDAVQAHADEVDTLRTQNAALLEALKAVKVAAVYCNDGAFSVSGETMRGVAKAIALAEGKDV